MCSLYVHKPRPARVSKKVAKGKRAPAKRGGPQAGPSQPQSRQKFAKGKHTQEKQESPQAGPSQPRGRRFPVPPPREEWLDHLVRVRQLVGTAERLAREIRERFDEMQLIMGNLLPGAGDLEFDELDPDSDA